MVPHDGGTEVSDRTDSEGNSSSLLSAALVDFERERITGNLYMKEQ